MMSRFAQRWVLAVLCILFAGCSVCDNLRRTMCTEPAEFSWKKDKRRSMALYSRWADEAWQEEMQGCQELAGRADYGMGFRDGFVDFTYAGGTGEPPPVPPRTLWNAAFRSEDGHRRTMDWYEGYRHGARVSRDGGYRDIATIRSSLFGFPRSDEVPAATLLPDVAGFPSDHWADGESLPAPDLNAMPATRVPATENPDPDSSGASEATPRDDSSRFRTPALPPVPHNLPPTAPRAARPGESDATPLRPSAAGRDAAANPTNERTPSDGAEPVPLSIPASAPGLDVQDTWPANETSEASPSTSTSVRFIGVSTTAASSKRHTPVAPPTPRSRPFADVIPAPKQIPAQEFNIRLTAATADDNAPSAPASTTSTVKIHPGWNSLRDPGSPQPTPALRPVVLK